MRVVMTMQSFDVGGGVGDFPSAAFLELQGAAKRDQKETGRVGLGFVADKLLIFGNPAQSRPMGWSMKKSRRPWGAWIERWESQRLVRLPEASGGWEFRAKSYVVSSSPKPTSRKLRATEFFVRHLRAPDSADHAGFGKKRMH